MGNGPPPVTGISELVLEVSDLEAASAFYGHVLGFEETRLGERRDDRRWYLVGDSARLGLWTPQEGLAGGRGGAHVHYAFAVPDEEIETLRERIVAAGCAVDDPIQLGPGRAIYVTDPDGNVVEFWSQDMAEHCRRARDLRAGSDRRTV
jgi:predicted enzyme related to lactoylglutathione lyase